MAKELGVEETLKLLEEVVAEFGSDYEYRVEYSDCVYTLPTGESSCIVGKVIEKVSPKTLKAVNKNEWTYTAPGDTPYPHPLSIVALASTTGLGVGKLFTREAVEVLMVAQSSQDDGFSWGESVERAKVRAKVVKPSG